MAGKEELTLLLERVQKATGPDREIDKLIVDIFGSRPNGIPLCANIIGIGAFTGSIDDAVKLVEVLAPGGLLDLSLGYEPGAADKAWPAVTLRFYPDGVVVDGKQWHCCIECAPTPPLAVLAAFLQAMIAQVQA